MHPPIAGGRRYKATEAGELPQLFLWRSSWRRGLTNCRLHGCGTSRASAALFPPICAIHRQAPSMWPDNETNIDYVNFGSIAGTVAEVIHQADGRPVSIGISGAWGVGKSSMIKLIEKELRDRDNSDPKAYIYVAFNAWLYQGHDDARAALMEVIATALAVEAEKRKTGIDKAKELLKRVNWLRVAKFTAAPAAALALGLPPVGIIGELIGLGKTIAEGSATGKTIESAEKASSELGTVVSSFLSPAANKTPPKAIQDLRDCFEATLQELDVKLVVLIDDLDRCLSDTTIATLEAIRLFLFLRNTAFVIAADDVMIKHAVKRHYGEIEPGTVINYFDKLIQVPIRVPPLGTQEVRAYMMLLFAEAENLEPDVTTTLRQAVCEQLNLSWQGNRVTPAFLDSLGLELPQRLKDRFHTADRLAPLMTTSKQIAGNPRLIKRFMNAISIRMGISEANGIGVDETVLAKMLLFERCADPKAYLQLVHAVTNDESGKARFLEEMEARASVGEDAGGGELWQSEFAKEWLTLRPTLSDKDLRGVLYVSREHVALITPEDQLSADGTDVLCALIDHPDVASQLQDRCNALTRSELSIIMDRLLDRAHQEQEWGTPDILEACLVIANADAAQAQRLASFLRERPTTQVRAAIVPKIQEKTWGREVLQAWKESGVTGPAARAINRALEPNHGNV